MKLADLQPGLNIAIITCAFEAHDFKMINRLSRTLKVMLRKLILIGLFVLNNNRTKGEPKSL